MFQCRSPIDGHVVYEGVYHSDDEVGEALQLARMGQLVWQQTSLEDRMEKLKTATDYLFDHREEIGLEITNQMGRPVKYCPGELAGVKERSERMLALAPTSLADVTPEPIDGFERKIERVPLGVVAVLAPWNYPFLTSVNAIIPALVAGNAVVLKHSEQTPLVALRYKQAFEAAGLPEGVFQHLFLSHEGAAKLVADARVDYVAFTGSVAGGHAITQAASKKFMGVGLELGGKDPAYVRGDADVADAAINIADGAFFNSGQSCCGIERAYVARGLFETFVADVVAEAKKLVVGNPRLQETTLGPLASAKGADFVRRQINDAIEQGATAHMPVDESWGSTYLTPQVLTNVTHDMNIMTEETFGPVVGIMVVDDDAQATTLMNDSQYGLTASIWTKDVTAARSIGEQLQTGTVFLNRCDYLDPSLAWTGVKNSGRGCTLSTVGYEHLTRPKSFHFKLT